MRRVLSLVLICSVLVSCHPHLYKGLAPDKFNFEYNWKNYTKKDPITNREFLTFLSWNLYTYGESYPDFVVSLLPWEV
ncbi:MAG: hypothetical protein AAF242_19605, partial [Bacteroidota bacterium]